MKKVNCSIYLATPMTGMYCDDIWKKAITDKQQYEREGITVVTPVEGEGIPFEHTKLSDRSNEEMFRVWKKKDKRAIKDTHVLVYECPTRWSQGVAHELILSRGVLWKPTVFIGKAGFITREEDDVVAESHQEAAIAIAQRWGNRRKRILWRLSILNRCLLGWIWDQVREFK